MQGGFTPRDALGDALPGTLALQEAREFGLSGPPAVGESESILVKGARGWFLLVE